MIIDILCILNEKIKALDIDEGDIIKAIDQKAYIHIFDNVKDFRQKGKVTYPLHDLLMMILICVFELGRTSYLAIADYIYISRNEFCKLGLLKDTANIPSHDTIRRVLSNLDSESLLEEALNGFYNFLSSLERNVKKDYEYTHTCIDGKENRGSGRHKGSGTPKGNIGHLNVLSKGTMTCIYSETIEKKDSEITAAQKILEKMDLKRKVITADALHCQRKTTEIIDDRKGRYVICVKDNQALLKEEIASRFSRYKYSTYTKENRIIDIYHLPKGYSTDGFKGLKCFARMANTSKNRKGTRYFISNSNDDELIAEAVLDRWSIENDLHKVKDDYLHEDMFHGTDKVANKNVAILNNIAVQLVYLYMAITGECLRISKAQFRKYPLDTINYILAFMGSVEIIDKIVKELKKDKRKPRK